MDPVRTLGCTLFPRINVNARGTFLKYLDNAIDNGDDKYLLPAVTRLYAKALNSLYPLWRRCFASPYDTKESEAG